MALKMDGRDAKLSRATFARFGERFGVPRVATGAMIEELLVQSSPFVARLGEIGFDAKVTKKLARAIEQRRVGLKG